MSPHDRLEAIATDKVITGERTTITVRTSMYEPTTRDEARSICDSSGSINPRGSAGRP